MGTAMNDAGGGAAIPDAAGPGNDAGGGAAIPDADDAAGPGNDAGSTAFEASEAIRLPRRRVWDLLTDFTAAPLWLSGVTEMHADGPLAPGAELDVHAGGRVRTFTIGDYIPGRELGISAGDGDMHTTYRYLLEDSGDDTLLTLIVAVAVAPSIASEAQGIRTSLAEAEAGQLAAFRRYAERAP